MSHKSFYLRTSSGESCGPGTQRLLSFALSPPAMSWQQLSMALGFEATWNISFPLGLNLEAGTWDVKLWISTVVFTTPDVSVTLQRRTSGCVVAETILQETKTLSFGTTEWSFSAAVDAITFNPDDLLVLIIQRPSGSGTPTLRYDDDSSIMADSRIVVPEEDDFSSQSSSSFSSSSSSSFSSSSSSSSISTGVIDDPRSVLVEIPV